MIAYPNQPRIPSGSANGKVVRGCKDMQGYGRADGKQYVNDHAPILGRGRSCGTILLMDVILSQDFSDGCISDGIWKETE